MVSNSEAIAYFPFEIVTAILLLLPVRSLCWFKCVSKQWLNLISSPKFAKEHADLNKEHRKEQLFFVSLSENDYSLLDLDPMDSTALQVRFQSELHPFIISSILGSCDGLLLLFDVHSSLFLVNPSTREYVRLFVSQTFDVELYDQSYGLGYDSSIDDYKVVQIGLVGPNFEAGETIINVYNLRANSWRTIKSSPHRFSLYSSVSAIFANGALHWLGHNEIVALDLASEIFHSMPLPISEGIEFGEPDIIGGCICIFERDIDFDYPFHVWVMKEYGVRDSWVKFTVDVSASYSPIEWLLPSRTGKLMFGTDSKVVFYDLEDGKCEETAVDVSFGFLAITYEESLIRLLDMN